MSTLIVPVTKIKKIKPHGNANKLEIAVVDGWETCVPKGKHSAGELVVYFPPDTLLPQEVTDRLAVTNYCSNKPTGRLVKTVCLRGEYSHGFIYPVESPDWNCGDNVAEFYQAAKYIPPPQAMAKGGKAKFTRPSASHPMIRGFTSPEHLRNYPDILNGHEVEITEKIHGSQSSVWAIKEKSGRVLYFVRSKNRVYAPISLVPIRLSYSKWTKWMKPLLTKLDSFMSRFEWAWDRKAMAEDRWFIPLLNQNIRTFLDSQIYQTGVKTVAMFGEIYGGGVQKLTYDSPSGIKFRAFDICTDGRYWSTSQTQRAFVNYGIQNAPVIYQGPYSFEKIKDLTKGQSLFANSTILEGVVVRSDKDSENWRGRPIFKYISDSYLNWKHGLEDGSGDVAEDDEEGS